MTKILYFSGTGNTLWSAKKIAGLISADSGAELINLGAIAHNEKIVIEADAVILLFPAYAYGAPIVVRNFVKKAEFKTQYFAVFVTYGTLPGGALADIGRILNRKKIRSVWYGGIPAVENYTAIFGPQKPGTIKRRVEMQRTATEEAAKHISNRDTNRILTFRPLSAFISVLFSLGIKIFYKWYKVTDACDGCGICEKVCPVSGITMSSGKPVFTKKCEHCQGCINWCPKQAILYMRVKKETARYHHPEISVADISR